MKIALLILLLPALALGQLSKPPAGAPVMAAQGTTHKDRTFWRLVAADIALNSVDVGTSLYDMRRYGTHEQNPLFGRYPSTARFAVQYAAMSAVYIWAAHRLDKHHPRIAHAMMGFDIGSEVWCVKGNFQAMKSRPAPVVAPTPAPTGNF